MDSGKRIKSPVDLHMHSNCSDGSWSVEALIAHSYEVGMRTIALSDHDTVSGVDEAISLAAGKLEVIPAVEINTIYDTRDVHILGYFVDCSNPALLSLLDKQSKARLDFARDVCANLITQGIVVHYEQIAILAGKSQIGKSHICRAIVAAGGADSVSEAYYRYFGKGRDSLGIRRDSVNPIEAIAAIREAGGLASIAHPGKSEFIERLIPELLDHGLEAIEVYHPSHETSTVKKLQELTARLGLLQTGGSDCHGPFQSETEKHDSMIGTIELPEGIIDSLRISRNFRLC